MKKLIIFSLILSTFISGCDMFKDSEKVNIVKKDSETEETTSANVDLNKVVAKVNDKEILQKDIMRKNLEDVIADEILFIEAEKMGIPDRVKHKLPEGRRIITLKAWSVNSRPCFYFLILTGYVFSADILFMACTHPHSITGACTDKFI